MRFKKKGLKIILGFKNKKKLWNPVILAQLKHLKM